MNMAGDHGLYYLNSKVRLISLNGYGVIVKESPFRIFRVNMGAIRLLQKCRDGLDVHSEVEFAKAGVSKALFPFLDRFVAAGVLEWVPSKNLKMKFVSVIVPVYNRAKDIRSCLESLSKVDYPRNALEIIVVDDNSSDETVETVKNYPVKLIVQRQNLGQSAARNAGVMAAKGEILAFIDSDCIAQPNWLRELLPHFDDPRNVLVGGYVDSYYKATALDRYEEANSALNMGAKSAVGFGKESDFYVPTCNMLVRREAYLKVGGLDDRMRVGEDVDLCWRLKAHGYRLVYVPTGRIAHKHRNRFFETFKRRYEYGVSEPVLYMKHQHIIKRFPVQPPGLAVLLAIILGSIERSFWSLPLAISVVLWDSLTNWRRYQKQIGMPLQLGKILRATIEKHSNYIFYLTRHLIRYYLLIMMVVAIIFPPVSLAVAILILFPSFVEFVRKRPQISFPVFLFYFLAEQAYYQAGVFASCVRENSFRPYRIRFRRSRKMLNISDTDPGTNTLFEKA
ncbi:MAG: mycofactocin biosynthesis glycosyltransferase MftF [Desulfomonilaceae bacterium]